MPKAISEMSQLTTRIPLRLRMGLKIKAIEDETTMTAIVVEALQEKLERDT